MRVNRTRVWFYLLVFILLISSFNVIAPAATIQFFLGEEGFEIEFPKFAYVKQNQTFNFHFHVFNKSNGIPVSQSISCQFHLYNSTDGSHLVDAFTDTPHSDEGFEFSIDKGNFTEINPYSYMIHCNDSTLGGFVSVPFIVTESGEEEFELKGFRLWGVLFLLIIAWLGIIVGLVMREDTFTMVFSMVMLIVGLIITQAGFLGIKTWVTDWFGVIHILIGLYILIKWSWMQYKDI